MKIPDFENVFSQYKKKIFALVYRLLKNPHEAEDITQEVFLRAYKNYKGFRHEAAIYSWLYRIAVNLCRDRIRWRGRQIKKSGKILSLDQGLSDKQGDQIKPQIADKSVSPPSEVLERDEVRSRIQEAIGLLPNKYARVFILREIEKLSYAEIATTLGISSKVVSVRLIRASKMLREKLKDIL